MKVVCIKELTNVNREDIPPEMLAKETFPVVGEIYTVRNILKLDTLAGEWRGYRFEEIRNPIQVYGTGPNEIAFIVHNFRPVTDISALTKLTKVRELEDA